MIYHQPSNITKNQTKASLGKRLELDGSGEDGNVDKKNAGLFFFLGLFKPPASLLSILVCVTSSTLSFMASFERRLCSFLWLYIHNLERNEAEDSGEPLGKKTESGGWADYVTAR